MDRDAVLTALRRHREDLLAAGIMHAAVFGSVARNEAGAGSDIDLMVEFAPDRVPDLFTWVGLREQIAALFPGKVDVVDRDALRPVIRNTVLRDALYAF